jgi:hypothetical protein
MTYFVLCLCCADFRLVGVLASKLPEALWLMRARVMNFRGGNAVMSIGSLRTQDSLS